MTAQSDPMTAQSENHRSPVTRALAVVGAVVAASALTACGGSSDTASSASTSTPGAVAGTPAANRESRLALVAYSTPKRAFDELTAAFERTAPGHGVSFSESFGPSGAQSRAVASGQPADVVAFSTAPDIGRLVKAGVVAPGWAQTGQGGVPADSVVVLVVRRGNPKHIAGWDDLVKPGVEVITPNPATSGSARWNVLAAYGAELREGRSAARALAYVRTLLTKNVAVQPASASAALQTFTAGKGDVLIDYESDAIAAERAGDALEHLIPKQTLLIQPPVAVTVNAPPAARAFVRWLFTPTAQEIWARAGYRPVLPSVAKRFATEFPAPPDLFTIDSLGGWTEIDRKFFGGSGSITKIERAAGVPTVSG